ncbi:MAG: hypothetical protein DWQ05_00545 [Calditrichaeota bacterium]|nr:MAG: hypothetical protein DWQ05_00545 [Calditrichota bacterium]
MKQNEFEKKLLQEKIAAHRRILQLETRLLKKELNPKRALHNLSKTVAPKLLAIPALQSIIGGTNKHKFKLLLVAAAAMLIPFVLNESRSPKNSQKNASGA